MTISFPEQEKLGRVLDVLDGSGFIELIKDMRVMRARVDHRRLLRRKQ